MRVGRLLGFCVALLSLGLIAIAGCGARENSFGQGDAAVTGHLSGDDASGGGSSGSGGSSGDDLDTFGGGGAGDAAAPSCSSGTGWSCQVDTTCGSSLTTLTGKVFDPAGNNPLYDVVVFIPNIVASLPVITPGTHTCNRCDTSIGDYVVATTTDATGSFTLQGVPTGSAVPVTVQIGKWRRTTTVNIPKSCSTNAVPDGTLHLPKNKGQGDMPQMALLTGGCDDLGCFMTNIGIDPAEFTAPQAGGRVNVYQGRGLGFGTGAYLSTGGAGNCTGNTCPLWSSKQSFEYYDIAIFSCECGEQTDTNESQAAYTNLTAWLNEGGKVFASHYHYTWFRDNPDPALQSVATWLGPSIAAGAGTYDLNTTFPKGAVFGAWLKNVNALAANGMPPTIQLQSVATSVSAVNSKTATQWIYDPVAPNDTKYLSFETPIGGIPDPDAGAESPPLYCGKAVFTDLHTSSSLTSTVNSIPVGCAKATLTPQQKALEFLFFDLSACVTNDSLPPPPPPMSPR
jgi:hypothetical protein